MKLNFLISIKEAKVAVQSEVVSLVNSNQLSKDQVPLRPWAQEEASFNLRKKEKSKYLVKV